jgi:hypothetical protein
VLQYSIKTAWFGKKLIIHAFGIYLWYVLDCDCSINLFQLPANPIKTHFGAHSNRLPVQIANDAPSNPTDSENLWASQSVAASMIQNTLTVILDTNGEHLRRLHCSGVGIAGVEIGRGQLLEGGMTVRRVFLFTRKNPHKHPGVTLSNLLLFRLRSSNPVPGVLRPKEDLTTLDFCSF